MSEPFGRRFEDPFDLPEEPGESAPERTPDETGVEDVRSQLVDEPPKAAEAPPAGAEAFRRPDEAERSTARSEAQPEPQPDSEPEPEPEHAPGHLEIPEGVGAYIGSPTGERRSVGIAVARFNGDITTRLLRGALAALEGAGVARSGVDVVQVPGAFELPLAAMALAKSRRYACVLALGCVIRGDTPHFEYVAGEAASGVQLAGLETGVPVSFGVLTCDDRAQAEARAGGEHGNKGAEAAVTALEMADVLARLRSENGARV
jgi:6,7-dimethyl-8-ribityllumazine synthase